MSEVGRVCHSMTKITDVLELFFNSSKKGLIIYGKRGIGKTFETVKYLNEKKLNYDLVSGYITPLEMYKKLYYNSNGIIIFDDVINIFDDKKIVSLLMASLDTTKSVVSWVSSYKALEYENIPKSFHFNGKIIIITNVIRYDDKLYEALLDRCIVFRCSADREEIKKKIEEIARNENNLDIFEWLNENMIDFTLRDYYMLVDIKKTFKENWKNFAKEIIENEISEELKIIINIFNKYKNVSNSVKAKIFKELTGLSERSFYRYYRKLRELRILI